MSDGITTTSIGVERESLLTAYRLRSEHAQHWSSPFAARRVHLIGIGGCGMSGLAGVMLRCGAIVSGSDLEESKGFVRLAELGATIRIGQAPLNLPSDCDFVVYSAAINEKNPELIEARRRGVRCIKYAEMLGEVMQLRTGIAIAGTHGKSTTAAMLAYILRRAKTDPTFVIGAEVGQLAGGSGVGDGPHFVVEACEYDRSFLNLSPKYAVILNIEEDHLDCFRDLGAIVEAFGAFASHVASDGVVVANGEDTAVAGAVRKTAAPVETFGFSDAMYWRAVNITQTRSCYAFDVHRDGVFLLRARMDKLPGRHQVSNALVATALAHHAGVSPECIVESLPRFAGVERRLTVRGEMGGVLLLDDYGHHPTEIQVTLRTVREHYPDRRLWVIFQPHQHSRTRFFLNDFAQSFGLVDHLLVPDIYFVRDSEAERHAICSSNLVDRVRDNGGDALYLPSHDQIVEHILAHAKSGDMVLTMGAGDVWKIGDELVRRFG